MYITSALQKTDMKAVGLQLALDLLHDKVRIYISILAMLPITVLTIYKQLLYDKGYSIYLKDTYLIYLSSFVYIHLLRSLVNLP